MLIEYSSEVSNTHSHHPWSVKSSLLSPNFFICIETSLNLQVAKRFMYSYSLAIASSHPCPPGKLRPMLTHLSNKLVFQHTIYSVGECMNSWHDHMAVSKLNYKTILLKVSCLLTSHWCSKHRCTGYRPVHP